MCWLSDVSKTDTEVLSAASHAVLSGIVVLYFRDLYGRTVRALPCVTAGMWARPMLEALAAATHAV